MSVKAGEIFLQGESIQSNAKINILAYGKASKLMYKAGRELVGEKFRSGLLISHEALVDMEPMGEKEEFLESTHPFITEKSLKAGTAVKRFAESCDKDDVLLALVSGGGSAMVALPINEISLEEKIVFITELMHLSVPERELTQIKKALSRLKGGKLAELCAAERIVNCILSDERNHSISAISSGMTVSNDLIDPIAVMNQYDLWNFAPANIQSALKAHGTRRNIATDKSIHTAIVGSREDLISTITESASGFGFDSVVQIPTLHSCTPEEATNILMREYEERYQDAKPGKHLVLGTGEVQVKVEPTEDIKGGRNQHLTALMMLSFAPTFDFSFCAVATDGVDYLEGVHGAVFDSSMGDIVTENREFIRNCVREQNTFRAHKRLGSLLEGDKTGTNLSDFFLFSFRKT